MYTVVEKAGYIGESDAESFRYYMEALDWMRARYTEDEIDELHVAIAYDDENGRTYEV